MNTLIRVDNKETKARIENALRHLPVDIYFVGTDAQMLSILKLNSIDAIVIGLCDDQAVLDHLRMLRTNATMTSIPIICCRTEQSTITNGSDRLEKACVALGATSYLDWRCFDKGGFTIEIEHLLSRVEEIKSANR